MDVGDWLRSLGLERYEQVFRDNEIDLDLLPNLTADDLKDLGVALVGHRRRLLDAIAALRVEAEASEPALPVDAPTRTAPAGIRSDPERRQLTVLFSDLVGSTALSAKLDPEEMSAIIRAYQNAVAGEITRFEGHIAKYMGDGVLAYFGWPMAHEDDPERAVRAALALADAVGELATPGVGPLAARVGIATGLVVVGELIGAGSSEEQAVVGETPNLAARLQALAEPGRVVIAASTRRLLGGLFELADLGAHDLKGFGAPVAAFVVEGERTTQSRFEARSGQAPLAMVGRDQELALLLERWALAKAREGQGVLLVGEAGIGKSRISRALLDAVAEETHFRIRYQCSPYHRDSALWPVIQQLGHAAGLSANDPLEVKLDKLEALLDRAGERDGVPLIANLIGLDGTRRYGAIDLDSQRQRERTLATLAEQMLGLAARQPVLVVLEDVHWIDPTTLELIEQCLDRIADARVLFLLTSRPDHQPELAAHPHVTRLTLNRLGRAGVEAIVARLGGERLPSETVGAIIARTDGVPLFVEELTKAVLETGEASIPASLHDSLMARLDRIPGVKEVAQIAACIGREFDLSLLATVAERQEAAVHAALDRLTAAELIFRRGTPPAVHYLFKHALVRDAAYESLLKSRREAIHARLIEALEPQEGTAPEILARHAENAGLIEKAIDYARLAGERAFARPAYQEAIAHFAGAIRLNDKLDTTPPRREQSLQLHIRLAQACVATLGHADPRTEAAYTRANELIGELGAGHDSVAVYYGLWAVHHVRSEPAAARRYVAQVGEMASAADDDAYRMLAARLLGTSLGMAGDFAAADAHFAQAERLLDPVRDQVFVDLLAQDQKVGLYCYWAIDVWCLGHANRARRLAEQAIGRARDTGHITSLSYALAHACLLASLMRDAAWLVLIADELGRLAARYRQRLWGAMQQRAAFGARVDAGDIDSEGLAEALAALESARAFMAASNAHIFSSFYDAAAAGTLIGRGRTREAAVLLADAERAVATTDERWAMAEVHRVGGLLHLAQGDQSGAAAAFEHALEVARQQQSHSWELRAATSLARLRAEQGRRAEAHDLLAPVYAWFTEGFDTADLMEAKALLDELT
ncbi:MAG TPA: adenylate/guanylate cyclase domain-containing protein [Geminicoccaceae bacterium]|nr:adenylate/guanylate cyclase domain-containing protein [Geminicoccaceae bacterium]